MPALKESWSCQIIDNQNPEVLVWQLHDEAALHSMLEHCRHASAFEHIFEPDEREGYNGVRLFNRQESYTAFLGKLTHQSGTATTLLTDLGRKLEKSVLATAPEPYRKQALLVLTIDFD